MQLKSYTVLWILCVTLILSIPANAQSTSITLPTSTSSSSFDVISSGLTNIFKVRGDGLVGIGQATPRAQLEVGGYNGILSTGTYNNGTVLALGAGMRFHWYPRTGALRAGEMESTWADDDGSSNPKLARYSIGLGYYPRASGTASVSIGAYNYATGDYALALGSYSRATASRAIAIGYGAIASGIYSVAIGTGCDTYYKEGSMVIGDNTYFQTAYAAADNQLTMRFSGGYRLWSSYPDSVSGVYMRHGQSGWSNYCDRNKKENFRNIDGEWLLSKISNIQITEWNYKKTDSTNKYIGPTAQDFYAAFKLNGTDSLGINSISIDGVNMAGVKALEKRTGIMRNSIEELKKDRDKINELEKVIAEQNEKLELQQKLLEEFRKEFVLIKNELNEASKNYRALVENKVAVKNNFQSEN